MKLFDAEEEAQKNVQKEPSMENNDEPVFNKSMFSDKPKKKKLFETGDLL